MSSLEISNRLDILKAETTDKQQISTWLNTHKIVVIEIHIASTIKSTIHKKNSTKNTTFKAIKATSYFKSRNNTQ